MSRSAPNTPQRERPIRAAAQHSPYGPCNDRTVRGPHSQPRKRDGCVTCRLRRKKCSDLMHETTPTLPCTNCHRLHIECLGYSEKRPRWIAGNLAAILADIKSFTRPFTQPSPSAKGSFSFRKYYDNDPSFNASFPIDVFGTIYDTLPHDAGEEEDSDPSSDPDETSTQSSTPSSTQGDVHARSPSPRHPYDPPPFAPSNALRFDVNASDNESSQGTTSPEPPSPIFEPAFHCDAIALTQPYPHMYGFNGATPMGSNVNPGMAASSMALCHHFQPHQYGAGGMAPFFPDPYVPCPTPDDANSYPNSESPPSSHNFDVMQLIWNPHYQQL